MDWHPEISSGYVETLQPNKWHTSDVSGPFFAFQSSPDGLGINAKAVPMQGLYALGAQYGFRIPDTPITITPSAGLAYSSEPRRELPLRTPFSLGLNIGTQLGPGRLSAEYWHLSNAGLKQPNIGLDNLAVMYGVPLTWP